MMDYDGSAGPLFERVIFAGFPGISPIVSDIVYICLGKNHGFLASMD